MDTRWQASLDDLAGETDFSGVVRVSRADRVLYELARGLADRAHRVANTIDTQFAIASGVAVIGAVFYQVIGGAPSLFAFAVLDAPLGGPPFFFVTGVAAGLGVNRDLVVPPVQSLVSFPLVQAVQAHEMLAGRKTTGKVLLLP